MNQGSEPAHHAVAARQFFDRIGIADFIQREAAGIGDFPGVGHGLRCIGIEFPEGCRVFQIVVAVGLQQSPGFFQGGSVRNAVQNVLQRTALGTVIEHLRQSHNRKAERLHHPPGQGALFQVFEQMVFIVADIKIAIESSGQSGPGNALPGRNQRCQSAG